MKGIIVNTYKKIIVSLLLIGCAQTLDAAVSCGASAPGVLNVGILPDNLPYSDIVAGDAVGFDPLLAVAVAKLLGYDTVNFIGYGDTTLALTALLDGDIDVYANSGLLLPVSPFIGVVTDISAINLGEAYGWALNPNCCTLAELLDAAITKVVNTGIYAQILQELRADGLTDGYVLGYPYLYASGILEEPFPYASAELGTIPYVCDGPVGLPRYNCIAAYLQSVCSPVTTFTGATGLIIP